LGAEKNTCRGAKNLIAISISAPLAYVLKDIVMLKGSGGGREFGEKERISLRKVRGGV